jgi:hypothetical protein
MYEGKKIKNVIMKGFETIVSKSLFYIVHFSTWVWIRIRICIPAVVTAYYYFIKFLINRKQDYKAEEV